MSKFIYHRCDNCGKEMGMPAYILLSSGDYQACVEFKTKATASPVELCCVCAEKLLLEAERTILEGTYITVKRISNA